MYDQPGIRYFVSSLADEVASFDCCVIKLQGLKQDADPCAEEMLSRTLLLRTVPVLFGFMLSLPKLLEFTRVVFFSRKTARFRLEYRSIDLSNEFDDVMDINLGLGWAKEPGRRALVRAVIEISYATFVVSLLSVLKQRVRCAFSADSAYRYGFIAKTAQQLGIPVLTNINMNGLFMNIYSPKTLAGPQGRIITESDCIAVHRNFPSWKQDIQQYFNKRFAGEIVQHDVLNAYRKDAETRVQHEKATSVSDVNGRVLVTLFAHVFRDAPRNIPGTLFGDFHSWFVESVKVLAENPMVLLYIREHPSAHLYGEEGLVGQILQEMGLADRVRLWGDENTDTVLSLTEVVLTCSGTVGLEAAYLAKPVIIASKCGYSGLGLCYEFETQDYYRTFLSGISGPLLPPSSYDNDRAAIVAYINFMIFDNRDRYPDFPLPPFVRGVSFGHAGKSQFETIKKYVSGQTLFNTDLRRFLNGEDSRFLPKLTTKQEGENVQSDGVQVDYSVVIVGYRSQRVISRCLRQLSIGVGKSDKRIQIVIVDNDPDRNWGTLQELERKGYLQSEAKDLVMIRSPRNGGFSFGCNLGAQKSNGRWLLFLNPDAFIAEDFFQKLEADVARVRQEIGEGYPVVMGVTMVDAEGRKTRNGGILPERFAFGRGGRRDIFDSGYMLKVENHDEQGMVWPLGASMLVASEVFRKQGGFDESLFLTLEEPSFLKRLGRYVLYFSSATVLHEGGHSYSNRMAEYRVFDRSLQQYYSSSNFSLIETIKILLTRLRIKGRMLWITTGIGRVIGGVKSKILRSVLLAVDLMYRMVDELIIIWRALSKEANFRQLGFRRSRLLNLHNWYHNFSAMGFETKVFRRGEYGLSQEDKEPTIFGFLKRAQTFIQSEASDGWHADGVSLVDLFCADAYYSIYALQKGVCTSAVGVDLESGSAEGLIRNSVLEQAHFMADLCQLGDRLTLVNGDVMAYEGEFDICLCLGGLYHIADPLGLLRRITGQTRSVLIIQAVIPAGISEEEAFFVTPAPNWSWGCRFNKKFLTDALIEMGWVIEDSAVVPLRANEDKWDRLSLSLLCIRKDAECVRESRGN